MKNQYFGDVNDYFKYDLCIYLAENLPKIQRFTFIPTLTANDVLLKDGNKVEYPMGVGRESLYDFLQHCLKEDRPENPRKVVWLRKYFEEQGPKFKFRYCPYGDSLDQEFTHRGREEYFQNIPDELLQSAVIMVDPDNGLDVKSSRVGNFHKFIKYSEARDLYQRMDVNSVLVVYQHFPRFNHEQYLKDLHDRIQEEIICPVPVTAFSSNIALIMLAKNEMGRKKLRKQVAGYFRSELGMRA